MIDRRSRWFPSEPKRWLQSAESDMLYRDFHNRVVPYRNDPEAYVLQTEGLPHYHVQESLSLRDHAWRLDGFLRRVACKLLTDHEVWIEVSFGNSGRNRAPFAVTEVYGVTQTQTGRLIQELPSLSDLPESFHHQSAWEREIVLDGSRMVHVELPDSYPSQLLWQVTRDLAQIATFGEVARVMDPWERDRPGGSLFNVKELLRTRDLAITKASLPIGWTTRESLRWPSRETNEFYYYWRELHFLHFRTSLRTQAEEALRQVLTLAGAECGFVASVIAQGAYTPQEAQEFIKQFEAGDISFSLLNEIILETAKETPLSQRPVM